jgi:hypothetical protein
MSSPAEQEVKRIERDRVIVTTRVLEKAKRRPSLGVQRDYLPVDHRIVGKVLEGPDHFSKPA